MAQRRGSLKPLRGLAAELEALTVLVGGQVRTMFLMV